MAARDMSWRIGNAGAEIAQNPPLHRHNNPAITWAEFDVSPYLNSQWKQIFDKVLSALLLLLLSPLLLLVVIAVRFSGSGPIFFRQRRTGLNHATFEILKFRSMRAECGADPLCPQATWADSRVTSIGRILRKTSLDELPQLVNVLRGEMSLVGPRPHALAHDARFLGEIPTYAERFATRPGITGLAQVSGARGETPTVAHMQRRVQYDLQYIRTASFSLDCKILLRTLILEITGCTDAY